MSDQVRGDSMIQIEKGKLKTHILEQDFVAGGYKAAGWTVVTKDWTKERKVKPLVDSVMHIETGKKPVEGAHAKKR